MNVNMRYCIHASFIRVEERLKGSLAPAQIFPQIWLTSVSGKHSTRNTLVSTFQLQSLSIKKPVLSNQLDE